jgi:protein-tyrosine phosphatase
MQVLRRVVSGNNRRTQDEVTGIDLDLAYITDRIIAMGYPSTGIESMYRNRADQVSIVLEQHHAGHFKVYNLAEKGYADTTFAAPIAHFPFPDHHPPALSLLLNVLQSMHVWLAQDPLNVVACHCLAGHGRTGVVVCCLLLYEGIVATAQEAFDLFAQKRSQVGKGVAHPSQIRSVLYAEQHFLRTRDTPDLRYKFEATRAKLLRLIQITDVYPNQGSDRFQLVVFDGSREPLFNSSWVTPPDLVSGLSLKYTPCVVVSGDFTIKLFSGDRGSTKPAGKEVLRFCLNADFIDTEGIMLQKADIDGPHADTSDLKFDKRIAVVLQLCDVTATP